MAAPRTSGLLIVIVPSLPVLLSPRGFPSAIEIEFAVRVRFFPAGESDFMLPLPLMIKSFVILKIVFSVSKSG